MVTYRGLSEFSKIQTAPSSYIDNIYTATPPLSDTMATGYQNNDIANRIQSFLIDLETTSNNKNNNNNDDEHQTTPAPDKSKKFKPQETEHKHTAPQQDAPTKTTTTMTTTTQCNPNNETSSKSSTESMFQMRTWRSSTVHLLSSCRSSSSSSSNTNTSTCCPPPPPAYYDVLDHPFRHHNGALHTNTNNDNSPSSLLPFHVQLLSELRSNGVMNRLTPAKTASDLHHSDAAAAHQLPSSLLSSLSLNVNVRGDHSTFISRQERMQINPQAQQQQKQQQKQQFKYPHLATLVQSIEHEARDRLSHALHVRMDRTSVQVARFSGDSRGYPRHCDTGAFCRDGRGNNNKISTNDDYDEDDDCHRIITAVYYLSSSDDVDVNKKNNEQQSSSWTEGCGGCLRVFSPTATTTTTTTNNNNEAAASLYEYYSDVEPIAGRLVLFRSDLVEHEVLPCFIRPRVAVTVWLYGKVVKVPAALDGCVGIVECRSAKNHAHTSRLDGVDCTSSSCSGCEGVVDVVDDYYHYLTKRTNGPPPLSMMCGGIEILRNDNNKYDEESSIFVSIPSYRDSEVVPTIIDLIQHARKPERVFVGLVLQCDPVLEGREVLDKLFLLHYKTAKNVTLSKWAECNLRFITVHHRQATGPCWARAMAQRLVQNERYILQIDSHMRFRQNWDDFLLQQLHLCPDPDKSILTTYPIGYTLPNNIPNEICPTVLVPKYFDDQGILRQESKKLVASPFEAGGANIPSPLWAAGFNFAAIKSIEDVPYDAFLSELFFGEELSMALRFHTHGYDFYAPPESVCYHLWTREHRPTFQVNEEAKRKDHEARRLSKKASLMEVKLQMRGKGRGLGAVRTVDSFARKVGVDFEQKSFTAGAKLANLSADVFVDPQNDTAMLASQVLSLMSVEF